MLDNPGPLFMVAAADVEAPATPDGLSLLDLFRQGRIGDGLSGPQRLRKSFAEWVDAGQTAATGDIMRRGPRGVRSFIAGWPSGSSEPSKVLVGEVVAWINHQQENAAGIAIEEVKDAIARVEKVLASWDAKPPVGLFAIGSM